MIRKFTAVMTAFAIAAMVAFAGCKQEGQKQGETPSAPGSAPTTTQPPSPERK